jgi:hypothetical protein
MDGFCPRKRERGLRIETFQGELLAYDLDRHQAHCLNGAAVTVWSAADGATTVEQIAARVAEVHGGSADLDLVWRALAELDAAHLLETSLADASVDESRRRALAAIGWAAAIPLVLSVAVPDPAYAQSIGPTGPSGDSVFG